MHTDESVSIPPGTFKLVNEQFMAQLAKGVIPWHQTFREHPKDITGRPFAYVNVWLLGNLGYARNIFLTSQQINILEYELKQGEEGHLSVYWRQENNQVALRHGTVFNIDQLQHVREKNLPRQDPTGDPRELCTEVLKGIPNTPIVIANGSTCVYYSLPSDTIYLPQPDNFETDEQWFSAFFYTLMLSTGHPKRCNRPTSRVMRLLESKVYDVESLVAEMGCTLLCSFVGIEPWYLNRYHKDCEGWLLALERDATLAITASIYAQQAIRYILNISDLDNTSTMITAY